jgi:hypothetical protein
MKVRKAGDIGNVVVITRFPNVALVFGAERDEAEGQPGPYVDHGTGVGGADAHVHKVHRLR